MLSGFINALETNTVATVTISVFALGCLIDIICLFKDKDTTDANDDKSDAISITK